ncbi:MAG: hypothetical protein EXR01_02700 [Acetobacteraceae bacterium]|nr:hypothetical protein [Acetobacteraceae bacterium]
MEILAFDTGAVFQAANIRAQLGRQGEVIVSYDLLIARYVRNRGLIVVTGISHEFTRVANLRRKDWTQE